MAVLIRRAVKKDLPEIIRNWLSLLAFHHAFDKQMYKFKRNHLALYKKFIKKRIRARNAAIFIAEEDGSDIKILESLKNVVSLGNDTFFKDRISQEAINRTECQAFTAIIRQFASNGNCSSS